MKHKKSAAPPLALATVAASLLVVTSFGTYAALTAEVSPVTPQEASTGTLILDLADNGVGFSEDVTGLAPGDVVNRYVVLTNSGTLDGGVTTLQIDATGGASLITDGVSPVTTKALTIAVTSCTVDWAATTGVCGGTAAPVLAVTPLSGLASAVNLDGATFASQGERYLKISLSLPDQDETTTNGVFPASTVQDTSVAIDYTFSVVQRTALPTNE
jgi:hypothetical protein